MWFSSFDDAVADSLEGEDSPWLGWTAGAKLGMQYRASRELRFRFGVGYQYYDISSPDITQQSGIFNVALSLGVVQHRVSVMLGIALY